MFDFKGKTALITGAAQGCGRVCALAFAKQGANVAMCDVNDEGGRETLAMVEAAGAQGLYQHADASREDDIKAFIDATVGQFGGLDIAVNNAAIEIIVETLDATAETFDKMYDLNLRGAFLCMKYEVEAMRKSGGGAIVNQASIAGDTVGAPDGGLYAATKGGVIGLTRSAALQVAAKNISINAIAFCGMDIPDDMYLVWLKHNGNTREEAAAWLPVKRLGKPEEMAAAVLYLPSDEARFMTGSVLTLDGGLTVQ